MFEDSVEGFIARWRAHATDGFAFARAEGSPLLEVAVGDAVVQLLERTGPYEAPTGPVRLVLHAVASSWTVTAAGLADARPSLAAVGLARLRLAGRVVESEHPLVVVDTGVPVVLGLDAGSVSVSEPPPSFPEVGDWIVCDTLSPAHGFVMKRSGERGPTPSPDDQV
jgi:hypothetical protein